MSFKNPRGRARSRNSLDHFSGNRRKGGRRWRIVPLLLIICAVVAALMVADYWTNHDKIYRGVEVGGVALGDKKSVVLINDLEATAYGVEVLHDEQIFTLNEGAGGGDGHRGRGGGRLRRRLARGFGARRGGLARARGRVEPFLTPRRRRQAR